MKTVKTMIASGIAAVAILGAGNAVAGTEGMEHSAADFNGDGMVTEDELVTFVRMHFMTMDKNNDHMVDRNEWLQEWFLDQ